jgi:hypothetical protein
MALTNDTGLPQWPKIVRWAESFDPLVRKVLVYVCECMRVYVSVYLRVSACVFMDGVCLCFDCGPRVVFAEMARVCRR